jgi:LPXTG-motif cell wall-anchored protein
MNLASGNNFEIGRISRNQRVDTQLPISEGEEKLSIKLSTKRISSLVGLAALAATAQGANAAYAAGDACTTSNADAITVGDGVCEITYLSTPTDAFKVPAGVSALQALLVAGGGAGSQGYAGGGGEVKVVDLQTSGEVTITVAAQAGISEDGQDSSVAQGADTYTAKGGTANGVSGNGNEAGVGINSGAGGAGGAGGPDLPGDNGLGDLGVNPADLPYYNGGPGLVVKDIAGATLFADDTDCFGGGGAGSAASSIDYDIVNAYNGVASCGAGSTAIDIAADTVTPIEAVPNSGGGAGASTSDQTARQGASGRVVLRYTLADTTDTNGGVTTLANTGGSDATVPFLFGAGMIVAGAFALRRRSN